MKMIAGKWKLVSGQQDGQDLSDADLQKSTLEITGNDHTVNVGDDVLKGTHTLDADQNPMTSDSTDTEGPFAGQSLKGIFKLESDEFTVCFAAPGKDRPSEFTTEDGKATIWHVWRRQTE
jgi:uncharacterized protein (TIGR03067 family)